jgi:hypothetical protein
VPRATRPSIAAPIGATNDATVRDACIAAPTLPPEAIGHVKELVLPRKDEIGRPPGGTYIATQGALTCYIQKGPADDF